ncbi:MAG: hypothetical protein QF473_25335, partial [Planctomycetota bacterium]|nr:hypothetical protein [Planctomycetota bacterium]
MSPSLKLTEIEIRERRKRFDRDARVLVMLAREAQTQKSRIEKKATDRRNQISITTPLTRPPGIKLTRIKYGHSSWKHNLLLLPESNMVQQFGLTTGLPTQRTMTADIDSLKLEVLPSIVYMTGNSAFSLTEGEYKVFRQFLRRNDC